MRLGHHAVRPLRRDPRREAVRAGLQRRRGPDLAGRRRLDRRARGRQVHHPGPRERLRAATAPASTGCTSATSPGRRPSLPAGGKPGEKLEVTLHRRRRRASRRQKVDPARRRRPRTSASARQDDRRDRPVAEHLPPRRLRQRASRRSRTTTTPPPRRSTPPMAVNGVIDKPGDVDHFGFTAKKGAGLRRPRLRPPAPLAARLGAVRRQRSGGAHRRQRRQRRARQLLPLHRPGRRRVRRLRSATT